MSKRPVPSHENWLLPFTSTIAHNGVDPEKTFPPTGTHVAADTKAEYNNQRQPTTAAQMNLLTKSTFPKNNRHYRWKFHAMQFHGPRQKVTAVPTTANTRYLVHEHPFITFASLLASFMIEDCPKHTLAGMAACATIMTLGDN